MANIKISELDEIVEISTDDILPIVDVSENETIKIKMGNIKSSGGDTLPIGAIVEYDGDTIPNGYEKVGEMSGSNSNGSWIKFADGTMIVTQQKVANANIVVADGNIFRGNLGSLPDFPVEFKEPPIVSLSLTNAFKTIMAGQEGQATKNRAFDNNGTAQIIGVYSATNRTVENVIINLTAIGRWK